jgi:5-formyltetrahydrofolate cyclo-ligase
MTKKEIREYFLTLRKKLTDDQVRLQSQQIAQLFFQQFALSECHCLHSFLPIAALQEVNTFEIIARIRVQFSHCKIVVPKSDFKKNNLTHFVFTTQTPLQVNNWGITEPIGGEEVEAKQIDIVVVPLLAFDERGYRVGYGKGFYDRFLAECRADTLKIGVSFFEPTEPIDDIHTGDISLDYCITPPKIWDFNP